MSDGPNASLARAASARDRESVQAASGGTAPSPSACRGHAEIVRLPLEKAAAIESHGAGAETPVREAAVDGRLAAKTRVETGRSAVLLETSRLAVRPAVVSDAGLYLALWTDACVMANVGFPKGLPVTQPDLESRLAAQGESPFARLLVVELKATRQPIGECMLALPDPEGISEPDIKLLPAFWGHKYGQELWRALVAYHFEHTVCIAVQTTPNVHNFASIRMMEAVGGVRSGEGVFRFPETMQSYTQPVHHYVYRLSRADWTRAQGPHRGSGDIPSR